MGKKDKKKGKGAEKTASKTEKKLNTKIKKQLALKGEEDIESLLAKFAAEDKKKFTVQEDLVKPPSKRSSFSITAHPEKDQIIIFGGEYFNGNKTFLYNDLFFYHIKQNRWIKVTCPGAPPPRSSHQAVALSQGGGQLWIFGGEFTSQSQSQFYHYKDLWVYHLSEKKWEKVTGTGNGPSSRSGHRMVALKKQLFVFGGFHDNSREFKYYNDVYIFNLENYTWHRLEIQGNGPCPRSACQMLPTPEGKIIIYGGFSKEKVKKDIDKGVTHSDMFLLVPDKHDTTGLKWKWQSVKQSGLKPSMRCAFSMGLYPPDKALLFGGVYDEDDAEDDDEIIQGTFYNDLYQLDLTKPTWHQVTLTGKKDESTTEKRKRRKDKETDDDSEEMIHEQIDELSVEDENKEKVVCMDGVFTVTVGPSVDESVGTSALLQPPSNDIFVPPPRINGGLVVKKNILYLYGGVYEDGDKQLTLDDFYFLDLTKLREWETIIPLNAKDLEWFDSESEDEDDSDDDDEDDEETDDEEMEAS